MKNIEIEIKKSKEVLEKIKLTTKVEPKPSNFEPNIVSMPYKKILENKYNERILLMDSSKLYESRIEFIGKYIFKLPDYDSNFLTLFTKKTLQVINAVLNDKVTEFLIKNHENYGFYYLVISLPFLNDKLELSLDIEKNKFLEDKEYIVNIFDDYLLKIKKGKLNIFMYDLLGFAANDCDDYLDEIS